VKGQIKWFDTTKGFGFITAEGRETDILLHANVLRNFGRNSIAGNSIIEVRVQETERGCQAIEIISIQAPTEGEAQQAVVEILGEGVVIDRDAPLVAARVKWFDRDKGFGFMNVFGAADDVFVHMEILHACGLSDLQSGEALGVKVATGPRGLMVWDVQVWDNAIPKGQ